MSFKQGNKFHDKKKKALEFGSVSGTTNVCNSKCPKKSLGVEHYTMSLSNPHFSVILSRQHMPKRGAMILPINIQSVLPKLKVPTLLQCYGKIWKVSYSGDRMVKAFNPKGWGEFVKDNELNIGDSCFFEL